MSFVFLDLESIPSQSPTIRDDLAERIKPPATLKKAESIAAWVRDEKDAAIEEAWLKTSFDGTYGQVVCVSYAIDDQPPEVLSVSDLSPESEAEMLGVLWSEMRGLHSTAGTKPVVVGHNHISFDLPFLWRRSVILKRRPPLWWPRNPKPWSDAVYDTMTQWAGDRGTISLDRLCRALGIEGKGDGPTGADVWPMVRDGRIAEVAAYCAADVDRTRAVWRAMNFW